MIECGRKGAEKHISDFKNELLILITNESEAHQKIISYEKEERDANSEVDFDIWCVLCDIVDVYDVFYDVYDVIRIFMVWYMICFLM